MASKFKELCAAYNTAQTNFEAYKKDCHEFSIKLVDELKSYFEVPDKQFTLYKIIEKGGFDLVNGALIHAIQLFQDNSWHFGVGFTVCKEPETLPEELILVHLMFKKQTDGDFVLKHSYGDKEFEIKPNNLETYTPFFEDIYKTIIDSYEEHLQQFLDQQTTRKLGFK